MPDTTNHWRAYASGNSLDDSLLHVGTRLDLVRDPACQLQPARPHGSRRQQCMIDATEADADNDNHR